MGRAGNPFLEDKIRLLKCLEVFRSLGQAELEIIAGHSSWHHFRKGETVFGKEEGAGRIYAVYEGEVRIIRSGDEQRDISLATFVKQESFGELSLFDRQLGDTEAYCEQDTTLLVFPAKRGENGVNQERLDQVKKEPMMEGVPAEAFFARYPRIGATILHNLLAMVARRIRATNRLIAEKTPWVQELRRQVMLDKLTGLYNASYLEEVLTNMIDEEPAKVCLLMLKPDNFKSLNDRYGHKAGDRTLQMMAAGLRTLLGDRGIPVRYKGDVFAVVLPGTGPKAARLLAEEVRVAMHEIELSEITGGKPAASTSTLTAKRADAAGETHRITVSVGLASHPGAGSSTAELIERAYGNLFTARNGGGNRTFGDIGKGGNG